jgi:putative DNA primase/helicase
MSALGLPMTALFMDDKPKKAQKINTITYEYKTADGSLAYRKQRYEFDDGSKSFAFYTPNGEKGRGGTSYPYNLPAVLAAESEIIYFCEGEKCVEAIKKSGRVATSLDAGANSIWKKEYNTYFEGKSVIILPDNDDPGMIYANKIARELPGSKIVKLPDLPKGGDIYDWLQQEHKIEELDELPVTELELPEPEEEISIEDLPDFIRINPFESTTNKNRYRWNDIGTSNWFADSYKNICRYCPEAKIWYIYNGSVWRLDVGGAITSQCGKAFTDYMLDCRKYIDDDEQRENWVKYVANRIKKKNRDIMLADASTVHPISIHEFDKDPYLLNVENGTIDLKTFTLRQHSPDDFLSKIANATFNESAQCDRWELFINEIMQDDKDKAQFLQKTLGYALTGDTSEECFFLFYGNTTRNGKGTTAETTLHILGDYGRTAQPETIAQKQTPNGGAPSEDVARLKGARFVNMSEPDKGLRLNSALVKSMTGGDTITARFLHQNSFEFRPEYKLFINTNHLPRVNDDSIFASGRVKLIPFERHFPENEQDKGLKAFFRQPENKSGILNWLLAGLRLLKSEGLKQPQAVRDATAQYRADSDIIGQFISECLIEKPNYNTLLKNVHTAYEAWCKDNGYGVLNSHNLAAELKKKNKKVERGTGNKVYLLNYALISDREDIPQA